MASTENGIIFGNIGKRCILCPFNSILCLFCFYITRWVFLICGDVWFFFLLSLWCVWSCQRQKLCCSQWHPHWHHGLHPASLLHGCRIQTDVGRVWVGKQGELCISTLSDLHCFCFSFYIQKIKNNINKQKMKMVVKQFFFRYRWLWTPTSLIWMSTSSTSLNPPTWSVWLPRRLVWDIHVAEQRK